MYVYIFVVSEAAGIDDGSESQVITLPNYDLGQFESLWDRQIVICFVLHRKLLSVYWIVATRADWAVMVMALK